jgi:hypothetical protein
LLTVLKGLPFFSFCGKIFHRNIRVKLVTRDMCCIITCLFSEN